MLNVSGAAIIKWNLKGKVLSTLNDWINLLIEYPGDRRLCPDLCFHAGYIQSPINANFTFVIPVSAGINFVLTVIAGIIFLKII